MKVKLYTNDQHEWVQLYKIKSVCMLRILFMNAFLLFFILLQFDRFMPSDTVTIATVFAPIMFPPASVLVYKENPLGKCF